MLNSVQNISYKESPFNDFALNRQNKNFFVEKKYMPAKEEKNGHSKLIITIAATSLVVGFGILGLMRGPKNTNKALNSVKNILEKKITKSANIPKRSKFTDFYIAALSKVNSFIEKTESINNFTSLKDAAFKKFTEKWKWTDKVHKKITKWFEKASRETVITSWHNTRHKMNKTFKTLEKMDEKILADKGGKLITINGVTKKGEEWVEILKDGRQTIKTTLENNTTTNKFVTRYKKIKTATKDLADVTWNSFKDLKNKDLYQTFVADRIILKDKAALYDEMNIFRTQISFTRQDKLNMARNLIKKVETLTDSKDIRFIQKITQLKADLKNGIPNEKLVDSIQSLNKALSSGSNKMEAKTPVTEMLEKAKCLIEDKNNGKLQEMLNIYEALLPNDYSKIQKQTNSFVKAIDKSINTESGEFFDKVRDLQIGSAPTDVLSMAGGTALIGVGLLRADNRDERISVTLKAGIPVIGALATSLYCTARLVSGGKAMAVGLVSGWLLNKAGEAVDKLRKKLTAPKQAA